MLTMYKCYKNKALRECAKDINLTIKLCKRWNCANPLESNIELNTFSRIPDFKGDKKC